MHTSKYKFPMKYAIKRISALLTLFLKLFSFFFHLIEQALGGVLVKTELKYLFFCLEEKYDNRKRKLKNLVKSGISALS